MMKDANCLDCYRMSLDIDDAVGSELKKGGHDTYPSRGEYYFDVHCPHCGRKQGLVVSHDRPRFFTIWPCSWNDEPCCEDDCAYCEGEYV